VGRASILLYDPALDALVSGEYIGATHPGEKHLVSAPQPIGHSISGKCFAEARPIVIDDANTTDIIPQEFVQKLGIRSSLAVPIMYAGQPIGVLRVDDRERTYRFNDELVQWVQLLAEQLAVVIQNARLYSGLNQRERDLRRISAELEAARDGAEQMVAAKSGFLARVSHELRTPLNAILGYTDLLRDEARGAGRQEMEADLVKMRHAADHLMGVIEDLLDLSRIEAGKTSLRSDAINLQHVVQEAVIKTRRTFDRRHNTLSVPSLEDAPTCSGDPTKLRQVLVTVLSYAARLSQHAKLTLELHEHQAGQDHCVVELLVTQPAVTLPQADAARLFDEFHESETQSDVHVHTSPDSKKGLGLAIARHLCRRMGGDLTASGVPGEGTRFSIMVPSVRDNC
jgi:signal transduction histidine kinase